MTAPLVTDPSSTSRIANGSRGPQDVSMRPTPTAMAMPTGDESTALAELVAVVGQVRPGDIEAHADLRQQARQLTARLAAARRIPDHLVVGPDDAVVLIARTLAVIASRTGES